MSWLTKFLGFDAIVEAKDNEIDNLYELIHSLQQTTDLKDEEIQRLTNLILTEHGVILRESAPTLKKAPQAVNKRMTWRERQKQFEDIDKQLASKQVELTESYWKDKSAKAEQEGLS